MAQPSRAQERAERLMALYEEGRTLDEVGKAEGVSRERIRQIFCVHVYDRYATEQRRRGRTPPEDPSTGGYHSQVRLQNHPFASALVDDAGLTPIEAWRIVHCVAYWLMQEDVAWEDAWVFLAAKTDDEIRQNGKNIGANTLGLIRRALGGPEDGQHRVRPITGVDG